MLGRKHELVIKILLHRSGQLVLIWTCMVRPTDHRRPSLEQTFEQSDEDRSALRLALESIEDAVPLRKIERMIDRLEISADAKALIMDIASLTVRVGEMIIAIGRKVVSFALGLIKKFPNTAFGIVIALIVGALLGSAFGGIPLLGTVLVAKLKAILLIFGIAKGALTDMAGMPLRSAVDELVAKIAPVAKVAQ